MLYFEGKQVFTTEAFLEGHPDKVADQVADAIVDAAVNEDPKSRAGIKVLVTSGLIFVAGEMATDAYVDVQTVARRVLQDIGYTDPEYGMDHRTATVVSSIREPSPEVDSVQMSSNRVGDNGVCVGYACTQHPSYMPISQVLANSIAGNLAIVRKLNPKIGLRPDGKVQVTVQFDGYVPVSLTSLNMSVQHAPGVDLADLREILWKMVVEPVLPDFLEADKGVFVLNHGGDFTRGGPQADTGVSGHKVVYDLYGPWVRTSGVTLSGKDGGKVDRFGTYAARYIAKHVVAAGLAREAEVHLVYQMGKPDPVHFQILSDDFNADPEKIHRVVRELFPLKAGEIIIEFQLSDPIYLVNSCYGSVGRNHQPWEQLDKLEELESMF